MAHGISTKHVGISQTRDLSHVSSLAGRFLTTEHQGRFGNTLQSTLYDGNFFLLTINFIYSVPNMLVLVTLQSLKKEGGITPKVWFGC